MKVPFSRGGLLLEMFAGLLEILQTLVGLGIVTKETKTIKEGGYYHLYSALDVKTFKLETEKRVKDLEDSFHRILRKFEGDLREIVTIVYEE